MTPLLIDESMKVVDGCGVVDVMTRMRWMLAMYCYRCYLGIVPVTGKEKLDLQKKHVERAYA